LFQDFTSTNKTVNEFDFPLLDFDQSMFTSEDHTKILMQADNILQSANHQLLDIQLGMTFEEKLFKVESQSSTPPFSRLVDLCYKVSKYTEYKHKYLAQM
jgi:hypothetical protein